ncbi:MAG: hypothetical protein AAF493_05740 [Pseudomonadota bacterium]
MTKNLLPTIGLALIALGGVVLAYGPGLSGPFVFDDLANIVTNQALMIDRLGAAQLAAAASSGESGLLGRPLAYISFATNYFLAGDFSPLAFKATNLAIHLINGGLVFAVARAVFRRLGLMPANALAGLVALIWLIHPLQLTAVLYTVQRMAELATAFVLLGVWGYLVGRQRIADTRDYGFVIIVGSMVMALLGGLASKENAATLPLLLLAVEWTLFSPPTRQRDRMVLRAFLWIFLIAPICVGLTYLALHPDVVLSGYLVREFDLLERLWTQARALCLYLGWLIVPALSELSLVHDDIVPSTGWFDPMTTTASLAALAIGLAAAIRLRRRYPELALGALWFIGAHSVESSIFALELVYEHRNYLPSVGIAIAFVALGARWAGRYQWTMRWVVTVVVAATLLGVTTHARASRWASDATLSRALVENQPDAPRAHGLRAQYLMGAGAAPRAIHDSLHRYAASDRSNLTALGELLRIRASTLVRGTPPTSDRVRPCHEVVNGPASASVRTSLDAMQIEFLARICRYPIDNAAFQALMDMSRCVLQAESRCLHFRFATQHWLVRAAANPRVSRRFQGLLFSRAAELAIANDDVAPAHGYLSMARTVEPRNPRYWVQHVGVFLAQNDRPGAAAVIERLRFQAGPDPILGSLVAELERAVAGLESGRG